MFIKLSIDTMKLLLQNYWKYYQSEWIEYVNEHDVKQLMAAAVAAKARVKVAEADALRVFKSAGCDAVTDRRRAAGGVDNDTTFDSGAQDARDASWNVEPFVTVVDGFSSGLHPHRRVLGQIDMKRVVG